MKNILFASAAVLGLAIASPAFAAIPAPSQSVTVAQGESINNNPATYPQQGVDGASATLASAEAIDHNPAEYPQQARNGASVTLAAAEAINHNPAEYPQQGSYQS
jgi:hypothetical protein